MTDVEALRLALDEERRVNAALTHLLEQRERLIVSLKVANWEQREALDQVLHAVADEAQDWVDRYEAASARPVVRVQ